MYCTFLHNFLKLSPNIENRFGATVNYVKFVLHVPLSRSIPVHMDARVTVTYPLGMSISVWLFIF